MEQFTPVAQHGRPVALVGDEPVLDDLLRLAAAAGCELERVPDVAALRGCWANAPLVLLDAAGAGAAAPTGLARRSGVAGGGGDRCRAGARATGCRGVAGRCVR
jgi:hypothetical protein